MSNMFDFICPKCGDTDHIDICAEVWIRMTDDGTDADASGNGDHLWDEKSPAECGACGHNGQVKDFDPELAEQKQVLPTH